MQLRLVASIVTMPLREIDYFNGPRHAAGAEHIDDTKVLKVRGKTQLAQAACVATCSDFGLKSSDRYNYFQVSLNSLHLHNNLDNTVN